MNHLSPVLAPTFGRALSVTGTVAVLALVSFALGTTTHTWWPIDGLPVALATALAAATCFSALRMAATAAGPRATLTLAVAFAAQLALPFFSAFVVYATPIVASHWRCGTHETSLMCMEPVLSCMTLLIAAFVVRHLVPRATVRVLTPLRHCASLLLAACVALSAFGAYAVATRPSPERWITQIPVAGELPEITVAPNAPPRIDLVSGVLFARRCDENQCNLSLAPEADTHSYIGAPSRSAGPQRVRIDRARSLAIVEALRGSERRVAFDLRTRRAVDVTRAMLANETAPPWPWVACALLGLALSLVAWRRGTGAITALDAWRDAVEASVTANGTLRSVDGTHRTFAGEPLTVGDTVLVRVTTEGMPFRDTTAVPAEAVWIGDVQALRNAHAAARCGRTLFACTVALWSATPLAVTML